MNLLFTIIGGKFKFQAQDSFLEYSFFEIWRSEKRIALSEKKPPLGKISKLSKTAICFDANFGAISLVNSTSPRSARSKTSTNLPRVLYVG